MAKGVRLSWALSVLLVALGCGEKPSGPGTTAPARAASPATTRPLGPSGAVAAAPGGDASPRGGDAPLPGRDGPLPGSELFALPRVIDVFLTIAPADIVELDERGNLEQYVAAAARVEGAGLAPAAFEQVGVRHKGSQSLRRCWDAAGVVRDYAGECAKLSLKLKFDLFDEDARLDGLKRLNLHASMADDSKLHELVGYQTFRDFGVDAPRAVPARVYVNEELRGLFIAVEEVDGRYTRAHYPSAPDGNVYKEVWPNVASTDAEFLAALETNEEAADVSDMRAFAEAVSRGARAGFDAEVGRFVDVDALLRYIAVDRAIRNWDGVMAFYSPRAPHNYYWYRDDGPEARFHLIPWDLDGTFWPFDPYMQPEQWVTAPPVPDINVRPLHCDPRPIWQAEGPEHVTPPRCDRLLDGLAKGHFPRLVELGRELLAGPMAAARLLELADQWEPLLAPIIAQDPSLDVLVWERALLEFRDIAREREVSFAAFLAEGLVDEPLPAAPAAGAGPDVLTLDTGLHIGTPTNFEFGAPPATAAPAGVYVYGDPRALVAAAWSTDAPLSGSADLRFDFTFNRGPAAYDEFVGVGLSSIESDVRRFSRVVVSLAADAPRQVRVRALSPAYDEDFGGVLAEFGMDYVVSAEPSVLAIRLSALSYPGWAKDDWSPGQGFPGGDAEALDAVLARFGGLAFGPSPTLDASGELTTASESGFLRIDDIVFE